MLQEQILTLLYKRVFDKPGFSNIYQLLDYAINNDITQFIVVSKPTTSVVLLLKNNNVIKSSYIQHSEVAEFYHSLPTQWKKINEGLLQVVPIEINHQHYSLRIQLLPNFSQTQKTQLSAFSIDIIK